MEMSSSMTMLSVGAAVTSWVTKPMIDTTRVAPRGTTMENLPSRSVVTGLSVRIRDRTFHGNLILAEDYRYARQHTRH